MSKNDKQINAYNDMLRRVKEFIGEAEQGIAPKIHHAIEAAKEKTSELGELTREEAETIGNYIKRDIHDAGEYLANEGKEFTDWLRFDAELVEDRLIDLLSHVVDNTKTEIQKFAQQAKQENIWMSGEVTSPGALRCINCNHQIDLHQTSEIPICPQCKGERFTRTI